MRSSIIKDPEETSGGISDIKFNRSFDSSDVSDGKEKYITQQQIFKPDGTYIKRRITTPVTTRNAYSYPYYLEEENDKKPSVVQQQIHQPDGTFIRRKITHYKENKPSPFCPHSCYWKYN